MSVRPLTVETLDYHVAGEPLRILLAPADLPGATMAEKAHAAYAPDWARLRSVTSEPRGHSDMFGAFRTPPVRADSAFGALFFDADPASAYKHACGHGTIALAAAACAEGWIIPTEGWNALKIDVPAGQVGASVLWQGGRVRQVRYRHVPSRPREMSRRVETVMGAFEVALVDAGAQVAIISPGPSAPPIEQASLSRLRATYLCLQNALAKTDGAAPDLVLFHDPLVTDDTGLCYRGAAFFGEGALDRSPCGTASSAMASLLRATDRIGQGEVVRAETMIGSHFVISVPEPADAMGRVIPQIETCPYAVGRAVWTLNPDDPLQGGFFLG